MTPQNKDKDSDSKDRDGAIAESTHPALSTGSGAKVNVVGIGASAGGLEALRQLLPGLPGETNLCYVIVQHLDPKHRSMLTKLLAPLTEMEVMEVADGQVLEPGKIFITPSGHDVVIVGDRLKLKEASNVVGPKPSVDLFLTSLAEELGERGVGIILSGTGSDGSHGMRAVKGGGGITMVQDPATAKYDGMPQAALDTGTVDLVLPPDQMGQELMALMSSPLMTPQKQQAVSEPDAMGRLLALIQKYNRVDFSGYKGNTINRRVARRIALHKLANLREYLDYVGDNPKELDYLTKDVLISVTSFFRDEEAFQALAKIIPAILEKKHPGDSVRVWVPGCSTGEEAYSIALLFAQHMGNQFDSFNLSIFGTDIDADAIRQARRGIYSEASLVHVDQELVDRYFRRHENYYQVSKSLRDSIVFAKQDLIHDPPFSRMDLISCRNLLIYLNSDLQRRIIPLFHYSLAQGGYLFLGKSESVGHFQDLFEPVAKRWRIFRRKGGVRAYGALLGQQQQMGLPPAGPRVPKPEPTVKQIAHQAMAEAMGAPAVLIDERQEVIHIIGDAGRFLHLSSGDAGLNILDLVSDQLRGNLRGAIHKAAREQAPVVSRRIRWQGPGEPLSLLNIHVLPVNVEGAPSGLTLIMFETVGTVEEVEVESEGPADARDQRISELEQELAANREHLQTTTEELETANEELQSLNEELQSANEELQSSNEELETSNEELQATNEELTTVNEELSIKSSELSAANTDLENILARSGLPMVVVDEDLKVRRFTPSATSIFNLVRGQRGQAITTVGSVLQIRGLGDLLDKVMSKGDPITKMVEGGSRYYEMRIYPYIDEDGSNHGAIITFYDQTEISRREEEFRALADNAPDIVARFDRQLRHLYVNRAVTKVTGKAPEDFIGMTNRDLGMPEELCDQWDRTTREVFESGEERKVRFTFASPSGELEMESRMAPEFTPDGRVATVLSVGRDITPLVAAEREAEVSADRFRDLLGSISDGFFSLDDQMKITYFNRAAGELLGREPQEVLGKKLLEAFPEATGSPFETNYKKALRDRQAMEFEVHFEREPYANWYHVRVYPYEEGISVYFQVVTREKEAREERERLEAQLRQAHKMEAVGTLAGGIAHDFNNLLAAIMGYAEVAMAEDEDAQSRKADLEKIVEASKRGAQLVCRILAFSRKNVTDFKAIDLNHEVAEAIEILRRTLPRMIAIEERLEADPSVILGDSSLIQQVIMNLGSNAGDAMKEGGNLTIATALIEADDDFITTHPSLSPGRYLRLMIEDTGPGIDPQLVEKIFDPFFTTKEVGSGTGLGLSIVYGIITDHQGHISCTSSPGQGTRFDIYLPLLDGRAEVAVEPPAEPAKIPGGDETILVVDDEPDLRGLATRILRQVGYQVEVARSGEEAIQMVRELDGDLDLVLLDIGMPGMSGKDCLKEMLEIDPQLKVLMISGYNMDDHLDQVLRMGAQGYVSKPYEQTELLRKLRETLDQE